MRIISFKKTKHLRNERNTDLLHRMTNGENLSSFNSFDSWYPPRPITEKDPEAINQLYGSHVDERLASAKDKKNSKKRAGDKGFRPLRLA